MYLPHSLSYGLPRYCITAFPPASIMKSQEVAVASKFKKHAFNTLDAAWPHVHSASGPKGSIRFSVPSAPLFMRFLKRQRKASGSACW